MYPVVVLSIPLLVFKNPSQFILEQEAFRGPQNLVPCSINKTLKFVLAPQIPEIGPSAQIPENKLSFSSDPQTSYPVTLLPPPRRLAPSLGLGTTWVRQPRSGSCQYPTASTKCNERPSQATANPVGGKACSSTKGGSPCYIPNTYSIHKVSNLKFAYFQGKLSRYTSSIFSACNMQIRNSIVCESSKC